MTDDALRTVLSLLNITRIKPSGTFYYMVECPVAFERHVHGTDHKPSCCVGHTDRPTHFKCFSCGYSGSVLSLASRYYKKQMISKETYSEICNLVSEDEKREHSPEALLKKLNEERIRVEGVYIPEDTLDEYEKSVPEWLLGLYPNITEDTYKSWGIRNNKGKERAVIPVYDKGGLRGITQRSRDPKGHKFLSNTGFKNHQFLYGADRFAVGCKDLPTSGGLILVEGQFDVIYMHQLGFTNTLGLFSANITNTQTRKVLDYGCPVYIFLDNDSAGVYGTTRAEYDLASKCPVYKVIYPEGFMEKADPKKLKKEQIIDLLKSAMYSLGI